MLEVLAEAQHPLRDVLLVLSGGAGGAVLGAVLGWIPFMIKERGRRRKARLACITSARALLKQVRASLTVIDEVEKREGPIQSARVLTNVSHFPMRLLPDLDVLRRQVMAWESELGDDALTLHLGFLQMSLELLSQASGPICDTNYWDFDGNADPIRLALYEKRRGNVRRRIKEAETTLAEVESEGRTQWLNSIKKLWHACIASSLCLRPRRRP